MEEVKRRAKVGEKVKIVDAYVVPITSGMPEYKNGDVLEIIGAFGDFVEYGNGFSDDGRARILNHEEYVVLEGENEMRFKVGDKARVKEGLVAGNEYGGLFFNNPMQWLCGKEIEINRVFENNSYGVRESIYYFNDAMLEPVPFTLSDLKPCMVVRIRSGELGVVSPLNDNELVVNIENGVWHALYTQVENDMTCKFSGDYDIMEVYGFSQHGNAANKISTNGRELLFKREEPKPKRKMTIDEICKELGEEIEIVKGE